MHASKRMWQRFIIFIILIPAIIGGFAALVYNGLFWPNTPARAQYPVRGVDVSSYQGVIHWPVLAGQGIDFAFIKATEGSGSQDAYFAANWAGVQATALRFGAYHFFSFDSPGAAQAENFITTVPATPGALPPVVDVEFYGDKKENPPDRAAVTAELTALLRALEAHYGQKPILYVTADSYKQYVQGGFDGCDLWVRGLVFAPQLADERPWTFWQYGNRGRLNGFSGSERFIDLNVFAGDAEAFAVYSR